MYTVSLLNHCITCPTYSYNVRNPLRRPPTIMEERFFESFIHCFFIAFGVIIGGSFIGSIGNFATGDAPLTAIVRIAKSLQIWAIVAAIGGTFDAIENFQRGLYEGSSIDLVKQALLILSAMGGVKTAMLLIHWFIQEDVS